MTATPARQRAGGNKSSVPRVKLPSPGTARVSATARLTGPGRSFLARSDHPGTAGPSTRREREAAQL